MTPHKMTPHKMTPHKTSPKFTRSSKKEIQVKTI